MSRRCHSVLGRTGLLAAVVTAASVFSVPVTTAAGPPQQGGGCNMVFGPAFHSPNSNGLDSMMAGSGGSANGVGAANMQDMLSRFSPYAPTFCFPP